MEDKKSLEKCQDICSQLQQKIEAIAPDQLRSIIAGDNEFNAFEAHNTALDGIRELFQCALLGHHEAIYLLRLLAITLTTSLTRLATSSEATDEAASNADSPAEPAIPWQTDASISDICKDIEMLLAFDEETIGGVFSTTDKHIPAVNFLTLFEEFYEGEETLYKGGATRTSQLVEKIVSNYVQGGLSSDLAYTAQEIAQNSWIWPICVSAQDYRRNKTLKETTPGLSLGNSIPVSLHKLSRQSSPSDFCLRLFKVLERQRTRLWPRNLLNEWEKGQLDEGSWFESDLWARKAAVLDPLNSENYKKWVDAAYTCLEENFASQFDSVEWPRGVEKRIVSTGSCRAALKKFVDDGFKTLATKKS